MIFVISLMIYLKLSALRYFRSDNDKINDMHVQLCFLQRCVLIKKTSFVEIIYAVGKILGNCSCSE